MLVMQHTRSTVGRRDFDVLGLMTHRTADFMSGYIDKKTERSSLRLLAPLRTPSLCRYINLCIHSFIQTAIYSCCIILPIRRICCEKDDVGHQ